MRRAALLLVGFVAALCGLWVLSKSLHWQWTGEITARGETGAPRIALTFDDGPSPRETAEVLAILAEHNVPATFYLNGDQMTLHAKAARAIAAAGHEIGNHGFTHRRMILRTPGDLRDELTRTNAIIRALGYGGPITFRPPYGQKLAVLPHVLAQMDMTNVMWSLDPEGDLGRASSASARADHVISRAAPGDIILLHPMFRANAANREAIALIVEGLKARGFEFVTVSALLAP